MTTGYGDLHPGPGNPTNNDEYTAMFSGTSGATAIVAGAAACLQGFCKARFGKYLDGPEIRDIFQMTGTPQSDNWDYKIGPLPDLRKAIHAITMLFEELAESEKGDVGGKWVRSLSGLVPLHEGHVIGYNGQLGVLRYLSHRHRKEEADRITIFCVGEWVDGEGRSRGGRYPYTAPIIREYDEVRYAVWEVFTMTRKQVINRDPEILGGTPVFLGTRVPVQSLIDHLKAGDRLDEFLDGFPSVKREQAIAFLEIALDAAIGTCDARAA